MTNEPDPQTDEPVGPSDPPPPFDPPPPSGPPIGPPPQSSPGARRLVRDPYSRLGGVASGLANHYGLDTSIVRIVFVLVTLGTGVGLLVYLAAWMIIPRAEHWPPGGTPSRPMQSLTRRDLGIGLTAVGLLAAVAFGGGTTGSILVSLVLVGGGVWLLMQPGNDAAAALAGPHHDDIAEPASFAYSPPGPPAPPRSQGRRGVFVVVLLALVGFFVVLPLGLFGLLIAGLATADFDFDFDEDPVVHTIDDPAQLPLTIDSGDGEITIDLSALDADDFEAGADPERIVVDMGAGVVTVLVPEDLPVDVDADVVFGSIDVFGDVEDGLGVDDTVVDPDPVVDIDIDLLAGEVVLERP